MAEEAFVAIGSNIKPQDNILNALIALKTYITITAISNFYKTAPINRPEQPDFLNGVVRILTDRRPRELKSDVLRKIEEKLSRVRSQDKFAPRTIDLDLILYGDLVIDEPDLRLPDPAIRIYSFVAIPLLELASDLILPDTKTALTDEPIVKLKSELHLESEYTEHLRRQVLA